MMLRKSSTRVTATPGTATAARERRVKMLTGGLQKMLTALNIERGYSLSTIDAANAELSKTIQAHFNPAFNPATVADKGHPTSEPTSEKGIAVRTWNFITRGGR